MSDPGSAISAVTAAADAGLVYVSDSTDGIRRVRHGSGFAYVLADNRRVTDAAELCRISRLAVPPAYEEVWICKDPRGHLQATGRDARGRKQYRYHPGWRVARDGAKFDRMVAFGEALPRFRRRVQRDLALPGLPREKVLGIVASVLDATGARIGNVEYARANATYGLTTLRSRHVRFVRNGRLLLRFRGKAGAEHALSITDVRLARLVRRCHQLPGQHLFQYIDDAGAHHPVSSDHVNAYLKETMGGDFTAKDFRSWVATVRAIRILRATPLPEPRSERALSSCIAMAVKQVAADLRNTPAVCRKSYINPGVFDAWRSGILHERIGATLPSDSRPAERIVLALLRELGNHHAWQARTGDARAVNRPDRRVTSHGVATA